MNIHGIIAKYKGKNHKILLAIFAVTFLFGIIHGALIFPTLLRIILKSMVQLKPGNELRGYWETIPFFLGFKLYLFNVTNPDDVKIGHKPIVHEVGPYYFEEWKSKHEIVEDDEEDTTTFYARNTFIFRPDLSDGLTGDEMVTCIEPLLTSIAINVKLERPAMIDLAAQAIPLIFSSAKDPFYRGRAMDIFFHGYPVDCSSNEFSAKAVCSALQTEAAGLQAHNETHFKFSIFGAQNGTDVDKFTVFRGMKNLPDIGRVIRFRDETEFDVWETDECNEFSGSDGTVFPPFKKREDGILAFVPALCRGLRTTYERKSSYSGLPAERYILKIGDARNDESLHCYCRDAPDDCPPKGVMDLTPCLNAPFSVSLPHFYDADPELLEKVEGLNPDKEKHGFQIDFERISGTPLRARNRFMFNINLMPVPEVALLKDVPEMLFPLFWLEETLDLNKTFTNKLKYQLFIPKKLSNIFKWTCLVGGFVGMVSSGYILYVNGMDKVTRVESKPKSAENNDSSANGAHPLENGVGLTDVRASNVQSVVHGHDTNTNGIAINGDGHKY